MTRTCTKSRKYRPTWTLNKDPQNVASPRKLKPTWNRVSNIRLYSYVWAYAAIITTNDPNIAQGVMKYVATFGAPYTSIACPMKGVNVLVVVATKLIPTIVVDCNLQGKSAVPGGHLLSNAPADSNIRCIGPQPNSAPTNRKVYRAAKHINPIRLKEEEEEDDDDGGMITFVCLEGMVVFLGEMRGEDLCSCLSISKLLNAEETKVR
jgi:hypothetical protein